MLFTIVEHQVEQQPHPLRRLRDPGGPGAVQQAAHQTALRHHGAGDVGLLLHVRRSGGESLAL